MKSFTFFNLILLISTVLWTSGKSDKDTAGELETFCLRYKELCIPIAGQDTCNRQYDECIEYYPADDLKGKTDQELESMVIQSLAYRYRSIILQPFCTTLKEECLVIIKKEDFCDNDYSDCLEYYPAEDLVTLTEEQKGELIRDILDHLQE